MPSRGLSLEQRGQPFADRPGAEDLDSVVLAEPIGDGMQEGAKVRVPPALGIIVPPARTTLPDAGVVADMGGTAHVGRDVRDELLDDDPAVPAQDPGRVAVDPHQGKALHARLGYPRHFRRERVPILGHASRLLRCT